MKATVTTQTLQLFPFGVQPAMLLTNDGPGTVFLGDDSSLSTEYGLPLPPLASIVWEEGRGLWAVSSSTAVLKYGRTTNSPVGTTDDKQRILLNVAQVAAGQTFAIETGSYQSLHINYTLPSAAYATNSIIQLAWYSSDGVLLVQDSYTSTSAITINDNLRFTVPVKGANVTITPNSTPSSFVVLGSTIANPIRIRPTLSSAVGALDFPARASTASELTIVNWGADYCVFTWNTFAANIALHNLGQTLSLTLVFDAIPGAGRFSIRDKISGATLDRFTISTTGAFNRFASIVPLSSSPELHWEVAPTAPATLATMGLVWS